MILTASPSAPSAISRRLAALSLLAALLLIMALPSARIFLLTKDLTGTLYGTQNPVLVSPDGEESTGGSAGYLSYSADHSPNQLSSTTDQDENKDSWSGPKRLRAVLASKDTVSKVFVFVVVLNVVQDWLQSTEPGTEPVLVELAPKDVSVPQELLRRPPPAI